MAGRLTGTVALVTGASSGIGAATARLPRKGSGVYNLTKFGVGAFSESLRQEDH